jgi:anthranilate phosphoribosyltransferase
MGISQYIKEIGRGQRGARPLDRAQAADLMGQVLDGTVSDLELGAFCLAMRIKGETPEEMAGLLDAAHSRMRLFPAGARPLVVLPSYNGARRLPVLTPLLALLLARHGLPVLIHGSASEDSRVTVPQVLEALGHPALGEVRAIADGELAYAPLALLSPGLKRLLDVRRVVGLRNSGHSMVKLMNPCAGRAVIVGSYTHREYAESMSAVFQLIGATALLLRGTEGEAVADARRLPQMDGFIRGNPVLLEEGKKGTLTDLPDLPREIDAATTAAYIRDVLDERRPVPTSMRQQVEHILHLADAA